MGTAACTGNLVTNPHHRPSRHHRRSLAIGLFGLATYACAYWFTYEPAPGVRVRWRDTVSLEQQASLERKYLLVDRVGPHPDASRSFGYALLDTRRSNIEALVKDPAVFDTNDIEDEEGEFFVRLGTAYSDRWMWVAHRTPLLRYGAVRWVLILGLAGLVIRGAAGLWRN
jgi:hypothetical protein